MALVLQELVFPPVAGDKSVLQIASPHVLQGSMAVVAVVAVVAAPLPLVFLGAPVSRLLAVPLVV